MDAAGRRRLADEKRFKTTNVANLYSLFCETTLALANPDTGVVTLIVPLTVSFGQDEKALRDLFSIRCNEIKLRHYDIRPSPIFNASPTVQTPSNSQRATILTANVGEGTSIIRSTGLQRWPRAERGSCLRHRATQEILQLGEGFDIRIAGQWSRTPTPSIFEMVTAIVRQKAPMTSYEVMEGELLAVHEAPRYYFSFIPVGAVSPRNEALFCVADRDVLRLLMAALNGHVAYGWWRVYGDGFHLKLTDFIGMTVPDAWVENPQPAINLGQRLIDAIPECVTETKNRGTIWRNVNFHLKPDLIAELDRLHLAALGLDEEPLLTHLRIMRSSSSWNYSVK